jgi:hypothetical protein
MPILSVADVTKTIPFGAPYTSSDLVAQIDRLHGHSVVIDGLQVGPVPGNPNAVHVYPGRALIRGVVVEITMIQTINLPVLVAPFVLYLDTVDEDPASATTLDFAALTAIPVGAVLVRQWSENSRLVEGRFATLRGRRRGVQQRKIIRSSGQTVFPLDGFAFEPAADELLIWAGGSKQVVGLDVTIQGLRTLTLASILGAGERLDIVRHSGMRFRQVFTGITGTTITLAAGNTFTPVLSDLLVFKNGILLVPGTDYSEAGISQITLAVAALAVDTFELYGVDGLLHRETFTLIAATAINLAFHAYRPGTHSLMVFGDGFRREPVFDYTETDGEHIEMTSAFTGVIHTVIMHSTITPTDVTRELGEFFDIGRDLADALNDPDGNRPSATPPSADNPLATVLDITTNQEVIDARGNFPSLDDRITSAVDASGVLVTHGALHAEDGTDPVPNATAIAGGLFSSADKNSLDAHIGSRGETQHAVALADPPTAGFISGSDQLKLNNINPLVLPKAVWAIRFYTDTNQVIDPQLLSGQQKSNVTFLYPTRDGTIAAFSPTNSEPFSLTIRFTMQVTVSALTSIFVSMSQVLMSGLKAWVDGVDQPLPFVGSRVEGSFSLAAGTHRIDLVGYGGGGGPIAGTRFSAHINLLGPGKPVVFLSAP